MFRTRTTVMLVFATLAALVALPATGAAQRRVISTRQDAPSDATTFLGADLVYAQPQVDFSHYVNQAWGVTGHLIHALDPQGIISLRAELGYLIYGQRTARQPLGGGALGLIDVDVTTSNNIVLGGLGLQLMAPNGTLRPYLTGTLGFSYFFTESSVAGSGSESFAQSENYSDGGFSSAWGGGLYIPLHAGAQPLSIDIGAQLHKNGDIQYLTANSISFSGTNASPVIRPIRSAADYVTYRVGFSVGIR